MAVDLTPAFHVSLYLVFLESLLFFAVIMQTKNVEPGTHSGVARYFGMVFLFQALACLFLVFAEQLYQGYFSVYFSILAVTATIIAVSFCVPAAAVVAAPEPNTQCLQVTAFVSAVAIILLSTFAFSSHFVAAPDIPNINALLRHELLGAVIGAIVVLVIASVVRMLRQLKGRNGALILLAGLSLILIFGFLWARFEPLCKQTQIDQPFPQTCPMPAAFDHNSMIATMFLLSNILTAEGVLRLMAAGSGIEGYAEIFRVISA